MVRDVFRSHFGLRNPPGEAILSLKRSQNWFFIFFSKPSILSFPQKLTFWVINLKIHLVEYVRMDHTDHFGFQSNFTLIWKIVTKKTIWGKSHFLRLSWKWSIFLEACSQKLLYVRHTLCYGQDSTPARHSFRRYFLEWGHKKKGFNLSPAQPPAVLLRMKS